MVARADSMAARGSAPTGRLQAPRHIMRRRPASLVETSLPVPVLLPTAEGGSTVAPPVPHVGAPGVSSKAPTPTVRTAATVLLAIPAGATPTPPTLLGVLPAAVPTTGRARTLIPKPG